MVDISDPADPAVVARLRNPRFTRAEDVVVRLVRTPAFTGTLAVVGIQACLDSGREDDLVTGLRFFDVTDPRAPEELSRWNLRRGFIGCHEVDLVQRADGRVLAGCARNLLDQINDRGGLRPGGVKVVDVTDPTDPRTALTWNRDVPPLRRAVGCFAVNFAHSVRFADEGRSLWVSYWDAGTVHLDISDPAAPDVVSVTEIVPPDEDGDNHSMSLARGGRWLVINPEDFSPAECPDAEQGGWGEVYVYDNRDESDPRFLGSFSTPNSRSSRADGIFSAHNTDVARRGQFFSSWYSDGFLWWKMDAHGAAQQLGHFVPPPGGDFDVPLVWGVYVHHRDDLVLASDFGSGLWILEPRGAGDL